MRLTLLPLLVLAVVATACGGSDDGPIVVQTTTTGMFVTTTAAPSDYSPATTTTPNVATTLVAVATTVVPATTTVALVDVPESVTVEKGDSLSKIAKRHDTTVEELMALNDIDDPNLLFGGQELLVDEVVSATEGPEENPNC